MKRQLKEAVALEYGKRKTPVVSARGEDDLAQRIIEEAQRHGVYVAEDPQLLALLSRIDLDQEIPPELFTAVSVILAWVYWLRGMRPGDEKADAPSNSSATEVPESAEASTADLELLEDETAEADSPQASL